VSFDALSPNFNQMCSKIGLIKRGLGLQAFFCITEINGVIPDLTNLGLISGWAY